VTARFPGMAVTMGLGLRLRRCAGSRLDLCLAMMACMVEFVKLPG
jgi:hypothetical protein